MAGAARSHRFRGHRSGQTIEGDLAAVSGALVAGAHVSIGTAGNSRTMTVSHAAGQFQPSASGAATQFGVSGGYAAYGGYGVWISRPGYLPRQHVVAMGSINERTKVMPQVVISGRVTDEDGFPAQNANVQALRRLWVNGRQELSGGGGTSTDD